MDIPTLVEVRRLRKVLPAPPCLPGEVTNVWTSQTWNAPSDGYVRACLSSGGGGGGGTYGGGSSALAFWRWRKILKGQSLVFTLGAGGQYTPSITDGGRSTLTAPWGSMTADPGKAGGGTGGSGGAGGISGTGADYYGPGNTGSTSGGGVLNPFCLPAVLSYKFTTPAQGWLAVIDLKAVGNGGATNIATGPGGGGGTNGSSSGPGGGGFGIFEYCAAMA